MNREQRRMAAKSPEIAQMRREYDQMAGTLVNIMNVSIATVLHTQHDKQAEEIKHFLNEVEGLCKEISPDPNKINLLKGQLKGIGVEL